MAKKEPNKPDDMKTVSANETQAEEKNAPGNEPLEAGSEAPAPELTAEETAALAHEGEAALRDIGEEQLEPPTPFDIPAPGDVVVSFDKINELAEERKVVGREAAQKETQEAPAEKEATAPEDKASEKAAVRKGKPPKAEKNDKPLADDKKIGFTPAVECAFIKPKNQRYIAIAVESASPTFSQAKRMRELDQKGLLNPDMINGIMLEEKKEVDKVILSSQELGQYFGKDKTPREMKDQIMTLLEEWKGQQKDIAKPEKKNEQEK